MESKNYICGGNNFIYSKGYIGLPIEVGNIPASIFVEGIELVKKNTFHVSLLCVKNILLENKDIEQDILDVFCEFIKDKNIYFLKYTGEFRFARSEERKTLVALCKIENLNELFDLINNKFNLSIPYQPTHITLYTLQPEIGIGLNSYEEMEIKSNPVDISIEVKDALGVV